MRVRTIWSVILFAFLFYPISADNLLRERVYMHTDKQTYLSGEMLWMKFYLTDEAGKPASFSKVGYVELLDESGAQVQVKLEITNGVAAGWMELPVTLPTGNYRLVAYTRNMRNEGETVFFDKTIGIVNTFISDATVDTDTVSVGHENHLVKGNITVSTAQVYNTRTQGEIRIQGLPENIHSLSVSVAGRDFVQSSDNIVDWNSRLSALGDGASGGRTPGTDFLPEYEGHIISGRITNVATGQPPVGDNVYSMLGFVGDQVRVFGGLADKDANVHFMTRRIAGTHELAVASIASSDHKYRVNIESPFAAHAERMYPPFLLKPEWEEQLLQRSVGLQVQYTYSADSINRVDTTYSYFQWKPDRSYILDEYTRFTTMEEVVIEFIPALRFRRYNNKRFLSVLLNETDAFSLGNTLVLLDGIPITDHEVVFKYNPLLLYKIDVYKDKFIFGNKHFDGMVFLTTYKQDYPSLVTDESTHLFDYEGTQVHRYFYAPSYPDNPTTDNRTLDSQASDNALDSRIPDFRHTLLWLPQVAAQGQTSLSVPFSTSDLVGEFEVVVEGLTKDGRVIRGASLFEVKNP